MLTTLAVSCILLCACDPESTTVPAPTIPTTNNPVLIKVGDSWLYRRLFINQGLRLATGAPDTIYGYKFVQAIKDTVIQQLPFLVLEATVRDIDKDVIKLTKTRTAMHVESDALIEISLDTVVTSFAGGAVFGRVAASNPTDSLIAKLTADSLHIFDVITPIRFPLTVGDTQTYRNTTTSRAGALSHIYEGQQTLTIQGRQVSAWKFKGILPSSFSKSVTLTDWIGIGGLLRREIQYGTSSMIDSSGNSRTIVTSELIEYLGPQDIDASSIKPWGP